MSVFECHFYSYKMTITTLVSRAFNYIFSIIEAIQRKAVTSVFEQLANVTVNFPSG